MGLAALRREPKMKSRKGAAACSEDWANESGGGGGGGGGGTHLLLEEVLLVQEENQAGVREPLRVADLLEELQRLVEAIFRLVLEQVLVELRQRRHEHNRVDVVEAVNPLPPLVALAAHIKPADRTTEPAWS
jgi:hypothetical protein